MQPRRYRLISFFSVSIERQGFQKSSQVGEKSTRRISMPSETTTPPKLKWRATSIGGCESNSRELGWETACYSKQRESRKRRRNESLSHSSWQAFVAAWYQRKEVRKLWPEIHPFSNCIGRYEGKPLYRSRLRSKWARPRFVNETSNDNLRRGERLKRHKPIHQHLKSNLDQTKRQWYERTVLAHIENVLDETKRYFLCAKHNSPTALHPIFRSSPSNDEHPCNI